ncbi:hypothetical protein Trydic_g14557 [Trypoxylus dichotomus]
MDLSSHLPMFRRTKFVPNRTRDGRAKTKGRDFGRNNGMINFRNRYRTKRAGRQFAPRKLRREINGRLDLERVSLKWKAKAGKGCIYFKRAPCLNTPFTLFSAPHSCADEFSYNG